VRLVLQLLVVAAMSLVNVEESFGQQFDTVYPQGEIMLSEHKLPKKVFEAQKNTFIIEARFSNHILNKTEESNLENPQAVLFMNSPCAKTKTQGSGFIEKESGYIISARHLLVDTAMNLRSHCGAIIEIDQNGIIYASDYEQKFVVIVETSTGRLEFPIEPVAMSPLGEYLDIIAFRSAEKIPVLGLSLATGARVGEVTYSSGFSSVQGSYYLPDGDEKSVMSDPIRSVVENAITFVESFKSLGIQKKFRLLKPARHGFSGGPLLNNKGEVAGMMTESDSILSTALSFEDIQIFIDSIKQP